VCCVSKPGSSSIKMTPTTRSRSLLVLLLLLAAAAAMPALGFVVPHQPQRRAAASPSRCVLLADRMHGTTITTDHTLSPPTSTE
jgi:hypothetical protein